MIIVHAEGSTQERNVEQREPEPFKLGSKPAPNFAPEGDIIRVESEQISHEELLSAKWAPGPHQTKDQKIMMNPLYFQDPCFTNIF